MGCCGGDREKGVVAEEQKWDYITLADFKTTSCWSSFSYCWLWYLALTAVGVYVSDTITAVSLLAFDSFGSSVEPKIPFAISKWIFAVCIILSWLLVFYEFVRAIRVIRRGSIAETYLDPMAAILMSIRINGRNEGYRRFLVFSELTKSKKGVDYIAFFVYFQFKGAFRIILAEGPRQVVNALTLLAVAQSNLAVKGKHQATDGHSSIEQFFLNAEVLANQNRERTLVLGTMLFSLVIWVFAALGLIIAGFLWICFLWTYIPASDGTLNRYCRRKVDRRLERIVTQKVTKAIEKQDAKWRKQETKALKAKGELPAAGFSKPTIPDVDGDSVFSADNKSVLNRTNTGLSSTSTLPSYPSRTGNSTPVGSARGPTLPHISEIPSRPAPTRTTTMSSSNTTYSQDAPLLSNAAGMSHDNNSSVSLNGPPPNIYSPTSASPYDQAPPVNWPPPRSGTSNSNRSAPGGPIGGPNRTFSPVARPGTAPNRQPNYTPLGGPGGPRGPPGPGRGPGGPRLPPVASSPLAAEYNERTYSPAPSNLTNQYNPTSTPGPQRTVSPLSRQEAESIRGGAGTRGPPEEFEMGVVSPPPNRMYGTPPPGRVNSPYAQPPRVGSPYGGPPRSDSPYGQHPQRMQSPYGGPGGPGPQRMQSPYQPPQYRQQDPGSPYSQNSAVPDPLGGQRF